MRMRSPKPGPRVLGLERPLRYAALLALVTLASFALILAAYRRATNDAVGQLYAQERILARQAASGLTDYFDYLQRMLRFLGTIDSVRDMDGPGKELLRSFYKAHASDLASVSRVDQKGFLSFTYPFESTAGRYLASQDHVARFLSKREPVLSGMFTAIQGFPAIALYCPIGTGEGFRGGIAVLVPFEKISKRYLERIVIGKTGDGMLLDAKGSILHSPLVPASGWSIYDLDGRYPGMGAIANMMLSGKEGQASFLDAQSGAKEYSYFAPVSLVDTTWSVMVHAPESEALGFILSFRNIWFALTVFLFAVFGIWALLLMRSFTRLRSANRSLLESNGALEAAMAELHSTQDRLVLSGKMAALGQVTASIAHQFNTPLGAILSANGNVIAALREEVLPALRLYASLRPELRSRFDPLMQKAKEAMMAPPDRRLRADRQAIDRAEGLLAARGLADSFELAECLAEMGALDEEGSVLVLAETEEGRRMIKAAAAISGALGSAMLVRYAAEKASGAVGALRTYVRADRAERKDLVRVQDELDLLLALYAESPGSGIRIVRSYAEDALVRGVPDRLSQIWVNIINNALHSMNGSGTLEVEVRRAGDTIEVAITDSGPGIPSEALPHIFEPFFTTKPQGDGSGIGLDIARGIAREHGGDICFESRPGRTTFVVSLPAAVPGSAYHA